MSVAAADLVFVLSLSVLDSKLKRENGAPYNHDRSTARTLGG